MAALHKKLGRDLLGTLGTLVAVVAIIAVGTGSFVGLGSAMRILTASQASYYRDYRFADFWIDVKKAPIGAIERAAQVPGVDVLEHRVVFDVILDLPHQVRPIGGRLISTPAQGYAETLNGLCLVRGSGFSDDRDEEVILAEAFAEAHGLNPGDRVKLILNRKLESYVIVGTAISPEYVYMVRGSGDIVPDPEHFGILYVKEDYAREVLDFKNACNQVVGRVTPGAAVDVDAVCERIDRLLEPYGVLAVTPRSRHASHRFLSDEIHGLSISARIMPAIFLGVAALILNILMTRLAERQRTIIGTLKALGYSDRQVFGHFLAFGVVVGVVGGIAGAGVGIGLAMSMIELYRTFFQFPAFLFQVYPDLLLIGLVISVGFAAAGTAKGVWVVLKLNPAEAMRQKPPERGGAIFLERFPRLWRALGFRTHMALRSMVRHRVRTATGIISCALATAIMFMAMAMFDSWYYLIDFQFEQIAHSDVDIGMRDERSVAALFEARALPGVDYAEPTFGVVCDLRNGPLTRRQAITGLNPSHRLTTPTQADGTPVDIPPEGLVMSEKLAQLLDLRVGERLDLTPVRGRRDTVSAYLASTTNTFLGLDCYADVRYLSGLVGEAQAINAVQLAIDESRRDDLYARIKELPNAQGLSVRADTRASIETTLVESSTASIGILIVFAGIIAFGSTLNNSLIEIGDRMRDISTFRCLGYRPGQVAGIFLRQNLIVFLVGLTLAYPLGYAMTTLIAQAYNTELYRIPVVIRPAVALWTAVLSVTFVLTAQVIVYRQIGRLDWAEGIKVKE